MLALGVDFRARPAARKKLSPGMRKTFCSASAEAHCVF